MPYRDIRPEYPPGALPAFVVAALLSDDDAGPRRLRRADGLFGVVTVLLAAMTLRGPRRLAGADHRWARADPRLPAPARLGGA